MGRAKRPVVGEEKHRLTLRFFESDYDRLQYWAEKRGVSINDFIIEMLELYIDIQNGNYQLPTLEIQRLNQLIEITQVLSRNVNALETITTSGFDSLLKLTRGDNYLLDEEDGEL